MNKEKMSEWLDSVPYCPICGKPMSPDGIVSTEF